jgi:oxidoreductase
VSSGGANKDSSFFYMRTKGQIDEAFRQMNFEKCSIFRPGRLIANRDEWRPAEYVLQTVLGGINWAFVGPLRRYQFSITVEAVARGIRLDFEKYWESKDEKDAGYKIIDNAEILDMVYAEGK